jgi:hypothetical protein
MNHALFMLRSIEAQPAPTRKLDYSLAKPGYVAMSKNAPHAFDELVFLSIALNILVRHELHQCLSNRKTDRFTHNSIIPLDRRNSNESLADVPAGNLSSSLC